MSLTPTFLFSGKEMAKVVALWCTKLCGVSRVTCNFCGMLQLPSLNSVLSDAGGLFLPRGNGEPWVSGPWPCWNISWGSN